MFNGRYQKIRFHDFEIYIMGLDIRDPKLISLGKTNTRRFWVTNLAYSMEALIQELVRILQNYSENDNFIKSIYELTDCKKVYQKNLIDLKTLFFYYIDRFAWLFFKTLSYKFGFRVYWRTWYSLNSYSNKVSSEIHEIKPLKGRFIADPNIFIYRNKKYILVEDCSIKTLKAFISCYEELI